MARVQPEPPPSAAVAAASSDTETWTIPPALAAPPPVQPAPTWQQPAQPTPPPPQQQRQQPPPPAQSWQQPGQAYQQPPVQQWQGAPPPPAQQSWQQPQQPWQQPQQQFQQPYAAPYGQPGYGQPAAYGQAYAQQSTGPTYGTSPLAAFAGLLLVIFGIGVIALGVFTITQGQEIARFIRDNDIAIFNTQISHDTMRSILTPSPGVLIVTGLLQFIFGVGVMAHKSWGRWLGFLLALIGLAVAVVAVSIALALSGGFTVPVIIAVVALVGYALIVLALLAGGGHFRRKAS